MGISKFTRAFIALTIGFYLAFDHDSIIANAWPVDLKDLIPIPIQPRIVNGQISKSGQFPYQALLVIRTGQANAVCGGSLLNAQWVITAAHCAVNAIEFQVHLGAQSFRDVNETGRLVLTSNQKIVHPLYNAQQAANDIALIKLNTPVNFTERIRPIKLPPPGSNTYVGANVIASGWGLLHTDAQTVASQLHWARLNIITNQRCALVYNPLIIRNSIICAEGNLLQSVCNGDSGAYYRRQIKFKRLQFFKFLFL